MAAGGNRYAADGQKAVDDPRMPGLGEITLRRPHPVRHATR